MSLYKTPDKNYQKNRNTPQHSTPIKSKLASPAASLSPVKHDVSTNYAAQQTWDSPSILRAGSSIHSSPNRSETPKRYSADAVDNSIKNHDIYQRLMQNGNHHDQSSREADRLPQKPSKTRFELRQERNLYTFGEGDSPKSDNVGKVSMTDDSDKNTNRELSPLETSTVQKQRTELELMITELRDRDRELNEMVVSHQKQLLSWEMDRQIVLNLSQKCASLQAELDRKTDQLHSASVKLRTLKAEVKQKDLALENTKNQLSGVSEQHSKSVLKTQDLQDMNTTLSESVRDMSTTLGELQAKEEQLKTLINHKDNELVNASSQITDMIKRLKKLDGQYKELRRKEIEGQRDVIEWKEKYAESRKEVQHLKGDLNRSNQDEEECKTEILKYKQQIEVLKQQLMLAGERERRKDDLLALQKSKQERTDSELTHLRLLYERQQRDLSLLHLNLESAKQLMARQRKAPSAQSSFTDLEYSQDGDHNSTVATETSHCDVTAQSESTLESHGLSSNAEPLQRQSSGEGFVPLMLESQTSSASSLLPSEDTESAHKDGPHHQEPVKSSQQVGELFDDSLQHALKINSISAGLRSKYLKVQESITEATEGTQPLSQLDNDSGSLASDQPKFDEQLEATDSLVRLTRSQDNVTPQGQDLKVIESEPCLGKATETSQNYNVNSHATEVSSNASVTSSSHSFYATPSSSEHRPLNETYQMHMVAPQSSLHKVSQDPGAVRSGKFDFCPEVNVEPEISTDGVPITVQEPLFSVKMSMDSGLNSSVSSTANSCRMTPTSSSLKYNEIPPSPCSTLERLLAESRIMVEQLEMNSVGALSTGSISSSDV